jgi:DNA-binding NtrC family response regulator
MPSPIRVLLADPDDPARNPLGATLRDRGMDVVCVRDPLGLAGLVAAQRFDVVVLDARLTGSGTAGALKAIRSVDGSTPVLLLALGSELAHMGDVLKPGYADFLMRPCAAETLIAAIEDASERESVPPPAAR